MPDCQGEFPWPHVYMTWHKSCLCLIATKGISMWGMVSQENHLHKSSHSMVFPLQAPCLAISVSSIRPPRKSPKKRCLSRHPAAKDGGRHEGAWPRCKGNVNGWNKVELFSLEAKPSGLAQSYLKPFIHGESYTWWFFHNKEEVNFSENLMIIKKEHKATHRTLKQIQKYKKAQT